MNESTKQLYDAITKYVRPNTLPVAVKVLRAPAERPQRMRVPAEQFGYPVAFCQAVSMARRYGWCVAMDEASHACPAGLVVMGYCDKEKLESGYIACPAYAKTTEAGIRMEQSNIKFPFRSVHEIWLAPSEKAEFEPDLMVVYGNPAQIARMIHAANFHDGAGVESLSFGRTACSSYIASVVLNKKNAMVVPSGGERAFAHTQDDEMLFAVPAELFAQVAEGLQSTHKAGLARYPTPFFGIRARPSFPDFYWDVVPEEYCYEERKPT